MTKLHAPEHTLRYTWHNTLDGEVKQPSYCRIMVVGIGGSGNNTVSHLAETSAVNGRNIRTAIVRLAFLIREALPKVAALSGVPAGSPQEAYQLGN